MKFGICGVSADNPARLAAAREAGLDYVEPSLAKTMSLTAQAQKELRSLIFSFGFRAEAFNGFFGSEYHFFGDEASPAEQFLEYVRKAADVTAEMGAEVLVLGSGKARLIPEGYDPARARGEFLTYLDRFADILKGTGLKIAIEPLQRTETNFINTVRQCVELTQELGREEIGPLADFFHVYRNEEPLSDLELLRGRLLHTHIARPQPDRLLPQAEDLESITPWAKAMQAIGYTGRLSLEGKLPDAKDAIVIARQTLRVFEEAARPE